MIKKTVILYFIAGMLPTDKDRAEAAKLEGSNALVKFRNASAVPSEPHALEVCDGVAGAVPKIYAEKFPSSDKAVKAKEAEFKALQEKVADKPAPKAPEKKESKPAANWTPNA